MSSKGLPKCPIEGACYHFECDKELKRLFVRFPKPMVKMKLELFSLRKLLREADMLGVLRRKVACQGAHAWSLEQGLLVTELMTFNFSMLAIDHVNSAAKSNDMFSGLKWCCCWSRHCYAAWFGAYPGLKSLKEDEAYEVCCQSLAKEVETGESTLRLTQNCLLIIAFDVLMRVLWWIRERSVNYLLEASVKGKRHIRSETEAAGEGERVLCLKRLSVIGEKSDVKVSEIADAPNDDIGHITADGDGCLANGTEVINLAEVEKQNCLDREAILEGKVNKLQSEKDAQVQKEASQSEKIKLLDDEKNALVQNEARLKERLAELEKENNALIQKEGICEEKIQQLQKEMNSELQKEASLEKEILELKCEKDSWAQTEAGFGPKLNQLVDEASLLNLKVVKLSLIIHQSVSTFANSAKESISSLTADNTKLRAQVEELELSRDTLFSETQQLKEFVSSLQFEMDKQTLENGHANYEAEAASALVEKLVAENSELVEKVSELHAELEQRRVRTEQFPNVGSVPGAVSAHSAEVSGASETITVSDGGIQSLEDAMVKDERNDELVNVKPGVANSSEIMEEDEIVQIPLDENEAVKESNMDVAQNDDNVDVSLTDSPLVGAPFRLISFVARYVSGADLVNANTG
ncbi:hypothetical protein SASPL_101903 [Salvia splendens]|uniref:Uncharacterized protein n=1 Tax=Salvia splendens TaxID=180675 RepID=A0A8X8YVD4_SALSN|nr:hypothetical protein SASPL_101903 [Salvia splendens]